MKKIRNQAASKKVNFDNTPKGLESNFQKTDVSYFEAKVKKKGFFGRVLGKFDEFNMKSHSGEYSTLGATAVKSFGALKRNLTNLATDSYGAVGGIAALIGGGLTAAGVISTGEAVVLAVVAGLGIYKSYQKITNAAANREMRIETARDAAITRFSGRNDIAEIRKGFSDAYRSDVNYKKMKPEMMRKEGFSDGYIDGMLLGRKGRNDGKEVEEKAATKEGTLKALDELEAKDKETPPMASGSTRGLSQNSSYPSLIAKKANYNSKGTKMAGLKHVDPESVRVVSTALHSLVEKLEEARNGLTEALSTAQEGWEDDEYNEAYEASQELLAKLAVDEEITELASRVETYAAKVDELSF